MARDTTRPERPTRFLDIPATLEDNRESFHADQFLIVAEDRRRIGKQIAADALVGLSAGIRGEDPMTSSPVVRTFYAWSVSEREIKDEYGWMNMLAVSLSQTAAFQSIPLSEFFLGCARALSGTTLPPVDATPSFRMGMKAVLDCLRGREMHTQLAVAAPPETSPDASGSALPIDPEAFDHEPTRPHVCADPIPPPFVTPVVECEEDTPVRRGTRRAQDRVVREDDLTQARLIPRTEILRVPK